MNNPLSTVTKTKTRTKTVVITVAALAVLGSLAWAGLAMRQVGVCDSGPRRGQDCNFNRQCITKESPGAICVRRSSPSVLPDLAVQSVTFNPTTRAATLVIVNQGNASTPPATPTLPSSEVRIEWQNSARETVNYLTVHTPQIEPGSVYSFPSDSSFTPYPAAAVRVRFILDSNIFGGSGRVTESNESNNIWEGDLPPISDGVARIRVALSAASPSGAGIPGLAEVLRFNVSASGADGQIRGIYFPLTTTDNNGAGTAGGDWNTWQGSTETFGLTGADFRIYNTADRSTLIPGIWQLNDSDPFSPPLDDDLDTAQVVTSALFSPSRPIIIPAGAAQSFTVHLDTTGASSSADDSMRLDIRRVETITLVEGLPISGNTITY